MFVVLAVAAWLRLRDLGSLGLGSDESVYAGQAQALAGASSLWPQVRAHPPLLPALIALSPGAGAVDVQARAVAALLGVVGVGAAMAIGRVVLGRWPALLAGAAVAVSPYHVAVTRQVLVDVPMASALALALLGWAGWFRWRRRRWLVLAGLGLGLAFLAKETAAVAVLAMLVAGLCQPRLRPAGRDSLTLWATGAVLAGAYPAWLAGRSLAGTAETGLDRGWSYLVWQFARPANEAWTYYVQTVGPSLWPLLLLGLIGAVHAFRGGGPFLQLLVWLTGAFWVFFLLWPVKGFSYLLPTMVPLAVLAAAGTAWIVRARPAIPMLALGALLGAVAAQPLLQPSATTATGVPAVREAGRWLGTTPAGCVLVGSPAMANILTYYSGRRPATLGLSQDVSMRNPAYREDPGAACVHYVVWDVWTARQSPAMAEHLVLLARRSGARVAHIETLDGVHGTPVPAVIVYEVAA